MKDELIKYIETQKEILSTLPKNNKKNIEKYISGLDDLKKEFIEKKDSVTFQMDTRKIQIMLNIKKENDYEEMLNNLNAIKSNIYLFDKYNTSYEKMGFDKVLYNLNTQGHTLVSVNDSIKYILDKFSEANIKLSSDDFKYTPVVYDYMKIYYEDNEKINEYFEKIYWKYPNIINHIEVTFKYLYFKYKKYFDKYIESRKNEFDIDVIDAYKKYRVSYDYKYSHDIYEIFNKFVSGKINTVDYSVDKIEALKNNYVEVDCDKVDILTKLSYTLSEYDSYLKYQFMIEDLYKLYSSKDQYKNAVKNRMKEISKSEKKLFKLSKKIFSFIKKGKNYDELDKEMCSLVDSIKTLYDNLDIDKFNEQLTLFNDNNFLCDFLSYINSSYIYQANCLKNMNSDITLSEIDLFIDDLRCLLNSPYNTLINNVNIIDRNNLLKIIVERYNLSNVKIDENTLSDSNIIEGTLDDIRRIVTFDVITNSSISIDDVSFICTINSILSNK